MRTGAVGGTGICVVLKCDLRYLVVPVLNARLKTNILIEKKKLIRQITVVNFIMSDLLIFHSFIEQKWTKLCLNGGIIYKFEAYENHFVSVECFFNLKD